MPKVIISDASCLILFHKIGELGLLHELYRQILVTESVSKEYRNQLPEWIQVQNPKTNLYKGLTSILDIGEATSIALAAEQLDSLLIIDELKGRRIAKELGIRITGSLGILVAAKNSGIIQSVKPIINKFRDTNFRLSDALISKILHLVDEG